MDFSSGLGVDLLPHLSYTMCQNRKFEDDSETELATETRMFQVQLTNALWHRTSPPSNLLYPTLATGPIMQSYKPLGFQNLEGDEDEEEEEDDEGEAEDDEPDEEEGEPVEATGDVDMVLDQPDDDLMDDSDEFA